MYLAASDSEEGILFTIVEFRPIGNVADFAKILEMWQFMHMTQTDVQYAN